MTPELLLGPHPCGLFALIPRLPFALQPCNPFSLGREPKAKVATSYSNKGDSKNVTVDPNEIQIVVMGSELVWEDCLLFIRQFHDWTCWKKFYALGSP